MNLGDFFPVEGYQEMARAETDLGRIVVLCNNSNYYLVASIVDESMTDGEGVRARLESSYEYGEDYQGPYRRALIDMVRFATHVDTGGSERDRGLIALRLIAEDMKNDAKEFDNQPFNGRTVAEYLGRLGAAVSAIAGILNMEISERAVSHER